MRTREVLTDGYESGVLLAKSWQEDGLLPAPFGEVTEHYRLVHKQSVEELGDTEGMQGPELSVLEVFAWVARFLEREEDLERIGKWSDQRVLEAVEQVHKERLQQEFAADRYPEMLGLADFEDAEAKGIAEVFNTDYRRILLCKDEYNGLIHTLIRESAPPVPGQCTTALFKDSPVGPIIGRNMDSALGSLAGLQCYGEPVRYRLPDSMGYSFLAGAICLNKHGLVVQGSSIGYPDEPTKAQFWVSLGTLIVRFCRTVPEALDLIDRYKGMTGPTNLLILDAEGDSAVVEKAHNTYAVRRTDAPWIFTTDGIAVEPATAAIQGSNGAADSGAEHTGSTEDPASAFAFHTHRYQRLAEMLHREASEPSIAAMSRVMRDHDGPSPVCKHDDRMPSYYPLATLYSFILAPQIGEYDFWVTRPGPVYPCQSEPTRYSYSFADE